MNYAIRHSTDIYGKQDPISIYTIFVVIMGVEFLFCWDILYEIIPHYATVTSYENK